MKKMLLHSLVVCLLLGGCTVTGRLQRRGLGARANYAPKEQKQEPKKESAPQYVEYKHRDSLKPIYFLPTTTLENGERVMSFELDEVVVVAKSRTVAERMGKVCIDFVIELPRQLQGNCRSVAVTPMLHKTDSLVPLQQISIRGGLFCRVQDRNYWQFDQYVRVFKPDAAAEQRAFERFVKHPYPEGVRLDSIVEGREKISYYYTQEVPTKGEGKTMHVTLAGAVVGLDGSRYDMPPLDTLEYNISSMLTFTDTTRRYLIKVIEKYAVVKDRNYLAFEVGKSDIIDTLETNAVQLARIESLMDGLINQREFYVDSIVLTASASPEGALALNERLARERALSLKRRLGERFGRQVDTLIAVRSAGENWTELGRLIAASDSLPHREAILALLGAEKNPDRREAALRGRYPQEYKHIRERLYPLLRSVDFRPWIFDCRPAFADRALFPDAEEVLCGDFTRIADYVTVTPEDYVVVMTSGHGFDFTVQEQVLRGETAYIGVIGSRRKTAAVNERLRAAGIPESAIARVHAPIGTAIRAVTPAEIAVSVAGEMICVRAERRGGEGHGCPMH